MSDDIDLPLKWVGRDGTQHEATVEHALEVLKLFYDEFTGGEDEFESFMDGHRKLHDHWHGWDQNEEGKP